MRERYAFGKRQGAFAQRPEIVATFKRCGEPTPSVDIGQNLKLVADPEKIFVLEVQLRQWVAPVTVETRRNKNKVRRETIYRIEQSGLPRRSEFVATRSGRQRGVEYIGRDFVIRIAGARIQRQLMTGREDNVAPAGKDRLGAVAVMYVEVAYRDPLYGPMLKRLFGGSGN